uniref:RRM domain-containing protein n=1 Tax=Ananas comosus var. bracteatus TaxID=296719 RepID=A0A6V7P7Z0_ANACO|nr:unnamed protein product [Ananas comosus var. bracteatus]
MGPFITVMGQFGEVIRVWLRKGICMEYGKGGVFEKGYCNRSTIRANGSALLCRLGKAAVILHSRENVVAADIFVLHLPHIPACYKSAGWSSRRSVRGEGANGGGGARGVRTRDPRRGRDGGRRRHLPPDADDDAAKLQELDEMKKRLKEMEDEAAALREMQAKVEKEMGAIQDPANVAANQASKEEVDSRSVFVGNVDYACTPEEVQQHFQSSGTVNRVTILTDKFGQPKGFAYVEFLEPEAVQEALLLNESELHGRQLKVAAKRTNVPGMKQYPPRRFNPHLGYRFRRPYVPPYFYSPYGYGKVPRFRRPMRYRPYF